MDGYNFSVKKVTLHKRMDGSTRSSKRTQQTQRRLFKSKKTSPQVAWKAPYFRPDLKDFSGLKKTPIMRL